ncbi:MAG: succinate dehydrogenase, cytochrome b556 subunit [Sphingobacteriia bacterium]|nr:succinate dehydrogenase, cytochrome b556 subunit [Sphingobacteriia bacterium]
MDSKYKNKPLSPHLSIYRPQITSVMSITHRATGFILYFALILIVWGLTVLTYCDHLQFEIQAFLKQNSCVINIFHTLLIFIMFATFYHLLNGLRHLYWDIGKGFTIKSVYITGYSVIIGSIVLTAISWLYFYKL